LRDMAVEGEKEPDSVFDAENYALEIRLKGAKRTVDLFQKVKVRISDEAEESTGKRKIKLALI
jgi:exosome complex exonuclease DIS3/RRP44